MEGFPFVHREEVRFRDLDAMGHVNNAVYLSYIEQARTEFVLTVGAAPSIDEFPLILARTEIDFRAPIRFGDTVDVGVRTGRLGTKSFDLEYELRVADEVVAEARSVQVFYDYERGSPADLPDEWRERLAA